MQQPEPNAGAYRQDHARSELSVTPAMVAAVLGMMSAAHQDLSFEEIEDHEQTAGYSLVARSEAAAAISRGVDPSSLAALFMSIAIEASLTLAQRERWIFDQLRAVAEGLLNGRNAIDDEQKRDGLTSEIQDLRELAASGSVAIECMTELAQALNWLAGPNPAVPARTAFGEVAHRLLVAWLRETNGDPERVPHRFYNAQRIIDAIGALRA